MLSIRICLLKGLNRYFVRFWFITFPNTNHKIINSCKSYIYWVFIFSFRPALSCKSLKAASFYFQNSSLLNCHLMGNSLLFCFLSPACLCSSIFPLFYSSCLNASGFISPPLQLSIQSFMNVWLPVALNLDLALTLAVQSRSLTLNWNDSLCSWFDNLFPIESKRSGLSPYRLGLFYASLEQVVLGLLAVLKWSFVLFLKAFLWASFLAKAALLKAFSQMVALWFCPRFRW